MRTIRYYGEVGLVVPSARTAGGFRLYGAADVERLQLVKRMKALEFTCEALREQLAQAQTFAARLQQELEPAGRLTTDSFVTYETGGP